MTTRMRVWLLTLAAGCLPGLTRADDAIQIPGRVTDGLIDADGVATLLVTDEKRVSSALFMVDIEGLKGRVDLPARHVGYGLTMLSDGRMLLESQDATRMHDRTQHYDIVEIRGNELVSTWNWNNLAALPGVDNGSDGFRVEFSGDGRAWGMGGGSSFSFGETGNAHLTTRSERFEVGTELADIGKWTIFSPGFVYLDSRGPVVAAPWNKGAFIVHFTENGSPVVTPILFNDGVEEYSLLWQWQDRVLWAETSLYWKGYELADLGVSGMNEEPVWVLHKPCYPDGARQCPEVIGVPHPQRGVVQLAMRDGSYRVEFAWRNPLTLAEERRASDWLQGDTPHLQVSSWNSWNEVFVSASGRHGVIVERRRSDGTTTSYVRFVDMQPTAPAPRLEVDRGAEAAADRELIGKLAQ